MLDREDLDAVRLLLARGASPNQVNGEGGTALHWAVWRGRSPQILWLLLDAGVDLKAKRADGRTAYAIAYQSGQRETCAFLAARGADTTVSFLDSFVELCAHATAEEIRAVLARDELQRLVADAQRDPAIARVLPDLASSHRTDAVRGLLAAGFPIDARGEHGGTALHWSCWKGYADLVKLLLDHGASLTVEDHVFQGTPPGWFGHGARNCGDGGGDYAAVARLLLAAGAQIPPEDRSTGRPEVDAVFQAHGLIP
jgi:ankyrin repeat protein